MITAGIDVGAENLKVAVLRDGEILSHSIAPQGTEAIARLAQRALSEAIARAGLSPGDIEYLAATGVGSAYIPSANEQATEVSCCARGTAWALPSARTVIDIGAEKCLVLRCEQGRAFKSARNDKCAAGTGRCLRIASKLLRVNLEDMGPLSLQSGEEVEIESTCAVFAESEIISLIHKRHRPEDILRGVFKGLARRIYPLVMSVGLERDVAMVGGIARSIGMVRAMQEQLGCEVLVPGEPLIVGALGAALIAAERRKAHLQASAQSKAFSPPGTPGSRHAM